MTDRGLRVAAFGVGALTLALVVTTVVLAPSLGLALEDMAVPAVVTTHVIQRSATVQPRDVSLWLPTGQVER